MVFNISYNFSDFLHVSAHWLVSKPPKKKLILLNYISSSNKQFYLKYFWYFARIVHIYQTNWVI